MENKKFTTYTEQIEILKSKGIIIEDEEYAINFLKSTSYFALVNGYKNIFKCKQDYLPGINFMDLEVLFKFDEKLRTILIKYILIVERKLKSLLSYYFCEKFGNNQNEYINVNNYNYIAKNAKGIDELVNILNDKLQSSKYKYIVHNRNKYGNVPLWVLINSISMGNVSKFFEFSQQSIRQKISNEYGILNSTDLMNMLKILTKFRNVCAHNERLYNFKTKESLNEMKIHSDLNLKSKTKIKGSKDLFAVVICFKYLLCDDEFTEFYNELYLLIKDFKFYTNIVNKKVVLSEMGFPNNWNDIKSI